MQRLVLHWEPGQGCRIDEQHHAAAASTRQEDGERSAGLGAMLRGGGARGPSLHHRRPLRSLGGVANGRPL